MYDLLYSSKDYEAEIDYIESFFSAKNINITRFSEPKASKIKNVVDVNFSIFYKRKDEEKYSFLSELHSMRHFNIEEISQISSECGFELIKCEEMISRDEPNESH